MEPLFEIILELVLQLLGDWVVATAARARSPMNVVAASVVAIFTGGILAACSLALHPSHLIVIPAWRITALLTVPVLNGFLMSRIGRRREKSGRVRSGYEHFFPAFLFSLTFGIVRVVGAK